MNEEVFAVSRMAERKVYRNLKPRSTMRLASVPVQAWVVRSFWNQGVEGCQRARNNARSCDPAEGSRVILSPRGDCEWVYGGMETVFRDEKGDGACGPLGSQPGSPCFK